MRWKDRRASQNVEDRRGGGEFFGVDPTTAYQTTKQLTEQHQSDTTTASTLTAEQQESQQFVATILADTEDSWQEVFQGLGRTYQAPKLVLFSGSVQSACGSASAAMGPFYCPADQKVYLDTQFFQDMHQQMDISGEKNQTELTRADQAGDFAMAYVIAHEVGHHVQNLLGISAQVSQAQAQSSQSQANQLSTRLELQADCFAGVWANKNQQRTQFVEQGDVAEAMDAAEKIGDDYLQAKAQGQVVPDSFTHGSSAQRQHWFEKGWQSGDIAQCDTF
jgi:predicted metalloprotease